MAKYIEKEALLDDLILLAKYQTGDKQSGILGCVETIWNRPAADVAPVRHGRWDESRRMIRRVNRTNIPVVECSVCGITFCDLINNHKFMYHFCPQCGAKMDGENNGEQV